MNRKQARIVSLLLTLVLLCGNVCFHAAAETAQNPEQVPAALSLARVSAIPEYQWQKTASFPDWKGYTDDTLAMKTGTGC